MTIYLTLQDVLEIHRQVIAETGGASGIRDLTLLDSAVHRPQASFAGLDLYPSLAEPVSFDGRKKVVMPQVPAEKQDLPQKPTSLPAA